MAITHDARVSTLDGSNGLAGMRLLILDCSARSVSPKFSEVKRVRRGEGQRVSGG
jgi:hypothetical protein